MALSTTTNKVIHSGNASATVFPFTFPIPDASYLSVIYTSAAGVETTLSPSLYSATGIGTTTGGSVTYPLSGSPIAASTLLTLVRTVPYTQTTVMANQGGYYPEVVEARFDLAYMAMQQLAEIVSRYTVSSISNPATEQTNYTLIQALQSFQTGIDKLTTAGDSLSHNGSAYIRLARGGASQFLGVSGTALAWRDIVFPKKHIYGLTWANGTDATNDLNIAVGGGMDDTETDWIQIAATTKQSDAVWAADNGATPTGGLDLIGSAGNNDFYVWAIKNPTSGLTGVLFSLSSTAPTMPSGYTLKRLVNWFKRSGGTIVAAKQYETAGGGLDFYWTVPTLDVSLANTLTTSGRADAVRVPLNFSTVAKLNALINDAAAAALVWIYNPDQTSAAPSDTVAPLANMALVAGAGIYFQVELCIRTSATGTIGARSNLATVDTYQISTMGFEWSRR